MYATQNIIFKIIILPFYPSLKKEILKKKLPYSSIYGPNPQNFGDDGR